MSDPYSDRRNFADADALEALESKVRDLDSDLSGRISSLDSQHHALQDNLDELTSDVRQQARETTALRQEVEHIQRRVERHTTWLLRAATIRTEAVAELDAVDNQITEWAEALRRGNAAGAQLLGEHTRSAHAATLARYDAWLKESSDLDAAFIAGATALAAARDVPAEADWTAYEAGKTNTDQHRETGRYLQQQAESAKAALDSDDALRAGFQPILEAHKVAASNLTELIVGRLQSMFKKGQTPPLWFVLALGDDLPEDDGANGREPDRVSWFETAVQLIRYRIIYGVTDPVDALGRPRYPSAVQEQRREVNAKAISRYS